LGSMLFKKKGEFLKVLNHILNRGANNCGGHCIFFYLNAMLARIYFK